MKINENDVKTRNGVIVFLIVLVLFFVSAFVATSVYIIRDKKHAKMGEVENNKDTSVTTTQNQENDNKNNITDSSVSESNVGDAAVEPETKSKYAEEYIKIIDKFVAENHNSEIKCDLIYFNNDDIPDLVIDGSGLNLYMYKNGKVYTLMENEPYGVGGSKYFSYLEKKGAIYNYGNSYAGAISQIVIKVLNSKEEFDEFTIISEGETLEPSDSMYEQVQKELDESAGYYYNGKKISEEEFNNKLKESSIGSNEQEYNELGGSKTIEEVKKQLQQ